jgi:TolB-like protein
MAEKLSGFEKFWQELKRRKTARVIVVYAATAFIILQLTDIIAQPLQLPAWTLTFVIVLLCIGFIIAVLLSWVYDITPAGVKRTKSLGDTKHKDPQRQVTSDGWKIATYASVIIVLALVVYNILSSRNQTEYLPELEKSIAVLPFKLLTEEPNKQYLADGMMEAILLNLQKFKDLRVLDRTSVEQYRETTKTTNVIIQELDVGYLLEGSFQKEADNVRLNVRLIKGRKQSNTWGKEYDRNWKDIFSVQSEVAKAIADELHTIITPNEMELLGKIPTANLTAYDLYLKATDYQKDYQKTHNLSSYQTAINLYKTTLEIDSAFAKAYTGLARAYFDKYYYETYFKENFLDTCHTLVNKALSFDDQLDEGYYLKGLYYSENGYIEEALDNYNQTLKINPNYYLAYLKRGDILTEVLHDMVRGIENYQKALTLVRGEDRPSLLRRLGNVFVHWIH